MASEHQGNDGSEDGMKARRRRYSAVEKRRLLHEAEKPGRVHFDGGAAVQDRAEPAVWLAQSEGGWSSDRAPRGGAAGARVGGKAHADSPTARAVAACERDCLPFDHAWAKRRSHRMSAGASQNEREPRLLRSQRAQGDYLPLPRAAKRARLWGRSAARSGRRPRAPTGASATHCRTPRGQLRSEGERDEGARPAAAAARPPGKTRTVVRAHGTHGGSTRRAHHKTGQSVKTRRFERAVSKLLTGCSGQAAPP